MEAPLRVSKLFLCLSGLLLLPGVASKAETFGFSAMGSGGGFSGSGVLTAVNNGNGSYSISAISGTGVTSLLGTNTFFTNDNLLFPGASRLVDVAGFSFNTFTGGQSFMVNIFSNLTGYEALVLDADGDLTDTPVTFTLSTNTSATPEPSTLALLGSGLMGIAGTAWRKRRA